MGQRTKHFYEFGRFRIDTRERQLLRDGQVVPLTPKVFDTLLALVQNAGRILEKHELMETLWPDTFVEEWSLSQNISLLRKALGEEASEYKYIETVPKRGYRFVAAVREVWDADAELIVRESTRSSVVIEEDSDREAEAKSDTHGRADSESVSAAALSARARAADIFRQRRLARRVVRPIAFVMLMLAISATVWLIIIRLPSNTSAPAPRFIPLTSYQGAERFPSFSPDGTQVAFVWDGERQDNFDIYTQHIGHGAPFRLTNDRAQDWSPAWSADGRLIAFLRFLPEGKAGVFLTTPLSRAERQLAVVSSPWRRVGFFGPHLAWSPDSKWIVTADQSSSEMPFGLVLVSVETGEKRTLTSPPKEGEGAGNDISAAFSPDGRSLAFIRFLSFPVSELYLLKLTDVLEPEGEPIRLTYEDQRTTSPVWTPDGREIIFASGDVWSSRLYRVAAAGAGKPRQIEPVGEAGPVLAISHTAHRLAYMREVFDPNIWRLQIGAAGTTEGAPASFISSTRIDFNPQFSPGGERVAFESNRSGNTEIWVCDSDGSNALKLTSFGGPLTGNPRWSPEGERIAFNSHLNGQLDIYLINSRGGTPERLTHEASNDNVPSWSRDGRWIYFHSNRSGASQVWKMRTDGSGAVQVTKKGGFAALESRDGKFLYYSKGTASGPAVWKVPVDGGEEVEVLEGISDWSTFAPTDQGMYFIPRREPSAGASLQFLSFTDGKIKTVIAIAKPVFVGLTISPDGQSLLYTQIDQEGSDLMLVEHFR